MNKKRKIITVLLVDDSPIALNVIKKMLLTSEEIEVIGTAGTGEEAIELIPVLNPMVVCTDIHMPKMDGYEFTCEIMARYPRPILLMSVSVQNEKNESAVFRILNAGAIDIFPKPVGGDESKFLKASNELVSKIKIISGVVAFHRPRNSVTVNPCAAEDTAIPHKKNHSRIVAIGASTGGPQTLHYIFKNLPKDYDLPIVCVQHISDDFLEGFVNWLNHNCKTTVRIARNGETPEAGVIYLPNKACHLVVDDKGRFKNIRESANNHYQPSIDITLKALADYYGNTMIGIILTGMGKDGVEGLRAVAQAGGITIAQDEASSVIYGMPKAAFEIGAARYSLSTEEIANFMISKKHLKPASNIK